MGLGQRGGPNGLHSFCHRTITLHCLLGHEWQGSLYLWSLDSAGSTVLDVCLPNHVFDIPLRANLDSLFRVSSAGQ